MSAPASSEPLTSTASSTPKIKKKNKKKKVSAINAVNTETNGEVTRNGVKNGAEAEEVGEEEEVEVEVEVEAATPVEVPVTEEDGEEKEKEKSIPSQKEIAPTSKTPPRTNGLQPSSGADTSERLEALQQERDALRTEVSELRKSLEAIQNKHEREVTDLQDKLEESNSGKDNAENQYQELLGRVNTIKAQLGERLKSDAQDLAQARSQIEELEEQNRSIKDTNESLEEDLAKLKADHEHQAQEVSTLRSRANLSQQNWLKERDELISREAYAREEFETAKQAMQDWEVLAMEERSLRETLTEKVAEMEEQISSQREALERALSERDTNSSTVDGLQRALKDIHEARKKELRELVETSQSQLSELRTQLQAAEESASSANALLKTTQAELTRALPFEQEVKEKNLLLGKQRHETVILNDHLTKALRFLKQRKPEDMVDRQLITNHLLHFITLDRADPKKFQVLQLIAALLSWNDEQKEQVGLARPGASNSALRVPMSPFRRTPSTPSLANLETGHASKESLAELWSDFLERESAEGASPSASRRPSSAIPNLDRRDSEKC
ncbi:hypothetical protein EJ08DRAFT_723309 [Tothia fuscella]|uniref:GRIP domain-containing protein n=1 Tax=Tothia fuscella TaxID=1048955 RepID=A0A9P4NJP8_9PEZI|nr:hypothetical protein EJ08DRAFT_723309 [Tothia fuscella]